MAVPADTLYTEDPPQPRPGILLWFTLIVSLMGALAFLAGAVMVFLSAANSTFGVVGGALMATFAAPIAAIIQFRAVARRQQAAAWLAGAIYWLLAGLSLWALVSNAIEAVVKKETGGMSFWLIFGAVCGEALSQLRVREESVAQRISENARIIGFRNQVVHGYAKIDDEITWRIFQDKLPVLRKELAELLAE